MVDKEQIIEQQQKTIDELVGCVSLWEGFTEEESKLATDSSIADLIMLLRKKTHECEKIKEKYEALKLENEEGYEIVDELKQECEKLKDYARRQENQRETYYKEFLKKDKALEEIEKLVLKVSGADECSYGDFNCSNCDDDCTCPTKVKSLILNIINKAKGGEDE